MERDLDELQLLDAFGIVAEAFKILRSATKLLAAITVTLLLPLSFPILVQSLFSQPLLNKIAMNKLLLGIEAGNSAQEKTLHNLHSEEAKLFLIVPVYKIITMAFSLMATSAVVYTVASIYTSSEVSYTRIMSVVPRVWKRLMVTFLWYFIIVFVYYVAVLCALMLLILLSGVLRLKSGTLFLGAFVFAIVAFSIHVYISMVWQVASAVSVVEESYGLAAMKRSRDLIKGKRDTALTLNILYGVVVGVIAGFLSYQVSGGRGQVMSVEGIVGVLLQCFVDLIALLTHSVFYFVSKSCHREAIDNSALSNHLDGYRG
ncbi:hypothetical protein KI387_019077, partial [Taxus chinensis]